jgi:hypothetical protein
MFLVTLAPEQRRHEEGAALERGRVAEGADRDVHARALAREGRQRRRHHHGRDVLGAQAAGDVAGVDAEALEHRDDALLGEGGVVERVARAVEADDEAVSDQLVLTDALEVGDVLDPGARAGVGGEAGGEAGREDHGGLEAGEAEEEGHASLHSAGTSQPALRGACQIDQAFKRLENRRFRRADGARAMARRAIAAGLAARFAGRPALAMPERFGVTRSRVGDGRLPNPAGVARMKVDNTPGLRGTTATRRADKGAARGGEFARHLDGSSQASGAGAASGVSVAAGIAGILSLQEVDDATASRKRAVRRAETLLDRLDELRHGLLMGTLSRVQLGELAMLVSQRRDSVEDPKLAELLDEIDLRVQVEIAKYEVESAA